MSDVRLSIWFWSVVFLYASIIPSQCAAADVTFRDGRVDGTNFVSIAGQIKKGDLSKVKEASKMAILNGGELEFVLDSPGGMSMRQLQLADLREKCWRELLFMEPPLY